MLVALAVILGGIWILLGLLCTLRIIGRIAGDSMQTLILILIFTHMVGMGFITVGGFIWAAWIMISFPFKMLAKISPPSSVISVAPLPLGPAEPKEEPLYVPTEWVV